MLRLIGLASVVLALSASSGGAVATTDALGITVVVADGTNSVFSNVSCCSVGKGFDLASGLGSPLTDEIAKHLHH